MDMELALDMLKLSPHIDHAVLFSGDGDFCRLLKEVQDQGIRVTVVSTVQTRPPLMADTLRRQSDEFIDANDLRDLISRPPRDNDYNNDDDADDDDYNEAEVLDDRRRQY